MKICFKSWVTDNFTEFTGIAQLSKQLKYFHPDIPHFIYGDKEMNDDMHLYPWMQTRCMMPISAMKYIDDYELVIHIDGDSTVTGPLDELFTNDYDAASVRNNHFGGGAGKDPIITIPGIQWDKFLNVGLNCVSNKNFLIDWLDGCRVGVNYNGWDDENNEFNRHFFNGKYKTKIIDDEGSGVSYGITNVFGTETHWDSWKNLYMKNGEVYQINPIGQEVKVKILHMAGGEGAKRNMFNGMNMREWMNKWISPDVAVYINKLSK